MKQEGFTPIGQTGRILAQGNPLLGGSNVGPTAFGPSLPDTARVAAWLARQEAADVDKVAVSRARQHGVGLVVKYEGRYPSAEDGSALPSYTVAVGCAIAVDEPEKLQDAIADMRNFMTPAPIRQIEAWLAELSVIVAKRQDDDLNESLRLEAYASRLSKYPADVARAVLLGRSYKFWPTWRELEVECNKLTAPRKNMLMALENWQEPKGEPDRRSATLEEKQRVAALVAEMFPHVSQDWRDAAVADAMSGRCMEHKPN